MKFVIPSCYSYTPESTYNTEVVEAEANEDYACEHNKKNGWMEEWLLDSGSTVNLTNQMDRLWDQRKTKIMVTVGDGSNAEGLYNGSVILKEKNTKKNLRITATYCPDFRKNISDC
jgi:hypothetical protein